MEKGNRMCSGIGMAACCRSACSWSCSPCLAEAGQRVARFLLQQSLPALTPVPSSLRLVTDKRKTSWKMDLVFRGHPSVTVTLSAPQTHQLSTAVLFLSSLLLEPGQPPTSSCLASHKLGDVFQRRWRAVIRSLGAISLSLTPLVSCWFYKLGATGKAGGMVFQILLKEVGEISFCRGLRVWMFGLEVQKYHSHNRGALFVESYSYCQLFP